MFDDRPPVGSNPPESKRSDRMKIVFILLGCFAVMAAAYFGSAGRWDLPLAWSCLGIYVAAMLLAQFLMDPDLRRELAGYQDYTRKVRYRLLPGIWCAPILCLLAGFAAAQEPGAVGMRVPVEAQPLAANVTRVLQALEFLGAPLESARDLEAAARDRDSDKLQGLLDPRVLLLVTINPESRVKVQRGPAKARLQQAGFTPVLVKIINQGAVSAELRPVSPQAGQVYAGMTPLSAERMQRTQLKETSETNAVPGRFLELEMYSRPPMAPNLSGLAAEYAIVLIYSSEAGRREATVGFEIGRSSQDLGFRGETPVLFDIRPAVPVTLRVRDHDGRPAAARFIFRDESGHVFPPQAKRLAPDFYFQPQIYRRDGDRVLLPPGHLTMQCDRGPEYRRLRRDVTVPALPAAEVEVKLERWVNPMDYGFYSGDHHIHGAGCAHYTNPTEGVTPEDMFLQVTGEGLNVGGVQAKANR